MSSSNIDISSIMNRIASSMKYQDLSDLSCDQIIHKYENLLTDRERQTRDLSYEFGLLNEKYFNTVEQYKKLLNENKELKEKLVKKEQIIQDEKVNKKIMITEIEQYTLKNDKIRKELKEIQMNDDEHKGKRRGRSVNHTHEINMLSSEITNTKGIKKLMSENLNYVPVFK